jgi:endonuclease/exonuclease/phosphatase (EEP) superfamily protein YafD
MPNSPYEMLTQLETMARRPLESAIGNVATRRNIWRPRTMTLIVTSLFPLALYLFSFLGRYFYLAELLCNFRAQLLVAMVPFLFLSMIARRWRWAALLVSVSLFALVDITRIYLPAAPVPAGPTVLSIMSFNVLALNSDHAAVIDRINDLDPDIVAIQEYANDWHFALDSLTAKYPYTVREPRWHGFGIAVFSKYPLANTQIIQLSPRRTDNPSVVTEITVGDQRCHLGVVHLLSPVNRYRMEIRNEQIVALAESVTKIERPLIVVGDCNCTPWSPFLQDFIRGTSLRDSRQGFGILGSWPADSWPMRIPIDHVFVSPEIHVHDRRVEQSAGSDHCPILVEISWRE